MTIISTHNPLHGQVVQKFNDDCVERLGRLGNTLRATGVAQPEAAAIVARVYMSILLDLFEPGLAFDGAFVAVAAQFGAEAVLQKLTRRKN